MAGLGGGLVVQLVEYPIVKPLEPPVLTVRHPYGETRLDQVLDHLLRTLRGLRNRHSGRRPGQKDPLQSDQLRFVLWRMGEDHRSGELAYSSFCRDRALLATAYFTVTRRSELAALRLQDLDRQADGYAVTVRRGKTDQSGQGRTAGVINSRSIAGADLLDEWLALAAGGPEAQCSGRWTATAGSRTWPWAATPSPG